MQPSINNDGNESIAVGYSHPPRIFRRPGEQKMISGYNDSDAPENSVHVPDNTTPNPPSPTEIFQQHGDAVPAPPKYKRTDAEAHQCTCCIPLPPPPPCPPPPPPPDIPDPAKPCNCPPRTYRNPPDVIVAAGNNVTVDESIKQDITTYTVNATPSPVMVDNTTMYGDGVNEPIGVRIFTGSTPGLVPEVTGDNKEKRFLRADGEWTVVDFPVDQSLNPLSNHAVSNSAVCAGLERLDTKIDLVYQSIQPIPLNEIHQIVNPDIPENPLDFDNLHTP